MSELPNREILESDFAKRFGKLARKHMREFRRLLGDPPALENVPQEFFDKMQRETDAELYAILLLIFDESAIYHGWDTAASGLAAYGWAKQRAEDFSKYWVESTQTRLANGFDKITTPEPIRETTVAEARAASGMGGIGNRNQTSVANDDEPFEPVNRILPGQPPVKIPTKEEIDELLDETFGENRIEQNAVDETTRARFAGGESAIEETVGISQEDRWRNNPQDSKSGPCPICTKLNGLKRSEWPWRYREGPPSPHRGCCCDVDYHFAPLSDAIGRMLDAPDYKSLPSQPRFNLKSWFRVIPNAAEWRAYCRENELDMDDRSEFKSFNPSEPRDESGKWTSSGSPHQPKETDKYVLRRTPDPEGDLKRGWSAWAGQYTKNPLDIGEVDNKMQSEGKDVYDIINDLPEDCVHETEDGWEINDTPEAMNAVAEWLRDELNLDVQKDPKSGKFALRHHEGLSSYELEAENPDDAIREGHHRVRHGKDTFLTGGRTGIRPVSYRHLGDDKYVFRVNNIGMQADS